MARTKQIKSSTNQEFQITTMTDENGQIWVQTHPGNWIKIETYNGIKERGYRLKLRDDIVLMTISQIKQRLEDLGQGFTGSQKHLRKKHYVEKLRSVLFSDL